jgi:hypothetical protein
MAPSIGEPVAAATVTAGEQPLTNQLQYLSSSMFSPAGTLDLKGGLHVERQLTASLGIYVSSSADIQLIMSQPAGFGFLDILSEFGTTTIGRHEGVVDAIVDCAEDHVQMVYSSGSISRTVNVDGQGFNLDFCGFNPGFMSIDLTGAGSIYSLSEFEASSNMLRFTGVLSNGVDVQWPATYTTPFIRFVDTSTVTYGGFNVYFEVAGGPGGKSTTSAFKNFLYTDNAGLMQ